MSHTAQPTRHGLTHAPSLAAGDLVAFLCRCAAGLANEGVIVLKENTAEGEGVHDEVDSSVTRTRDEFLVVFQEAGQHVVLEQHQDNFPQELYPVHMWVRRQGGEGGVG